MYFKITYDASKHEGQKNYFAKNIVVLSKKTSLDILICSECNNILFFNS